MSRNVLAIDVSGSVFDNRAFLMDKIGAALTLLNTMTYPEGIPVEVILFDMDVVTAQIVKRAIDFEIPTEARMGGGTDFRCVLNYLKPKADRILTLYVVSDGYMDFGEKPDFPVVFFLEENPIPPYGSVIQMRIGPQTAAHMIKKG